MHGNTILIKVSPLEYIYIGGMSIYSFKTTKEIYDYISPVGNSDVPYPVAYSENGVYFMGNQTFVKKENISIPISVANAENLYGAFYGHNEGITRGPHQKMKGFKVISKRRMDIKDSDVQKGKFK